MNQEFYSELSTTMQLNAIANKIATLFCHLSAKIKRGEVKIYDLDGNLCLTPNMGSFISAMGELIIQNIDRDLKIQPQKMLDFKHISNPELREICLYYQNKFSLGNVINLACSVLLFGYDGETEPENSVSR